MKKEGADGGGGVVTSGGGQGTEGAGCDSGHHQAGRRKKEGAE